MKADTHDIKTIFGGEIQLFAPLFQRPYVWDLEKQLEPFWEDIQRVAEALLVDEDKCKPHFLGAVVLDQMKTPIGRPDARSIIDGQQRLTTLQMLMAAVCHLFADRDELALLRRQLEKLIFNLDVANKEDEYKVWPTNVDRPAYVAVIRSASPAEVKHRLTQGGESKRSRLADAYQFFYKTAAEWLKLDADGAAVRCQALVNAVRTKLRIVVIDMDDQDDAQVIFETLNARGTPLLPSDLVKNYLFQRARDLGEDVERLHEEYWENFEVDDAFWRTEMVTGRLKRTRIDVFLQYFLSMQNRTDIIASELFSEFCDFFHRQGGQQVEPLLSSFHRHAQYFRSFVEGGDDDDDRTFFRRLKQLEMMTVYPFLLALYEANNSEEDQNAIMGYLESFLVRRMVCQLTTQGYNRFFLESIAKLESSGGFAPNNVCRLLSEQTAETSRWPNDDELRAAWLNVPLYALVKRMRIRLLLEALDSKLHTPKVEHYKLPSGLTVEHLLPQHWEQYWPLCEVGETPEERAEQVQRRNAILHTIGNLTLLTSSLNPAVSNGSFDLKKEQILKHSAINLNRPLQDELSWDEVRIIARGERLLEVAKSIWPYPSQV